MSANVNVLDAMDKIDNDLREGLVKRIAWRDSQIRKYERKRERGKLHLKTPPKTPFGQIIDKLKAENERDKMYLASVNDRQEERAVRRRNQELRQRTHSAPATQIAAPA